jgi:hypothetical protein
MIETKRYIEVWVAAATAAAVGLLLGACARIKPEDPIDRAPQACCTSSDFQLKNFKGCRVSGGECRASKNERFWMRGYVVCGPVDKVNCEGGRCCSYEAQYDPNLSEPVEDWKPPGSPAEEPPATQTPSPAPSADDDDPEAPLPPG